MTENENYYRREHRQSKYKKQEYKSDTFTLVLTAQIFMVLLIIVSAWVLKYLNADSYHRILESFKILVTNTEMYENTKFSALIDYVDKTEDAINALPFVKEKPESDNNTQQKEQQDSQVIGEGSPEDLYEPGYKPEAKPSREYQFNYDYLAPGEDITASEKDVTAPAQGGYNPVMLKPAKDKTQLNPPANSVVSPFYISASVTSPVGGIVTSKFGFRDHPITGAADFHNGIDIAAAEGTAILAALPGTVKEVGESQIYGRYIVISHADNLETSYSHCSEIIASEGMKVRAGERIAKVGSTGISTGPHLHFAVIIEGLYANPLWVMRDNIEIIG